jgi:4-hydroxybenzoate polyprenyltransferase
VGIPAGAGVAAGLFLAGAAIAFFLPVEFAMCLAFYVAATLAYSFALKKIAIVDAIVLAGLYTLRLMVGHAVTGVAISVWLLAFSIFLFFSLALVKRFVEVGEMNSGTPPGALVAGRGYCAQDYWLIGALGISSGALSVLVLILYVNSPEVRILYQSPVLLMLLAPIFLYWIGRVWLLASRGKLHEDPVLFALRDKTSYAIGLVTAAVIFLSAGFK